MKPVRVLFIHPFGLEGGSENVLIRLVSSLDAGFTPSVLLLSRGPFAERVRELGIDCHVKPLPGKRSVPRFPLAARSVAHAISASSDAVDVIHANGTKAALFGGFLKRRLDAPLLWMKHGHDYDIWAPRMIGPACDRIVAVSHAVADTFPASLRDRIAVHHPGVPLPPEATPASATEPVIATVGRVDPRKGGEALIRAVGLLRDRGVPARLEIAGPVNPKSPRHGRRLQRLIERLGLEERVSVLGWVDDVNDVYRRARVVALASRGSRRRTEGVEGTPLVLLEGMSHARPVVATRDAGIEEIVGDAGTLVRAATPEPLAEALEQYLRDPQLAERVGERGRRRVEGSMTVAEMTRQMQGEYLALAERG